jgi:hypothetical protein
MEWLHAHGFHAIGAQQLFDALEWGSPLPSRPAGAEDPAVVRLVRKAGYLLAVTSEPGLAHSAREPLLLQRDEILRGEGVAGLAALLHSGS